MRQAQYQDGLTWYISTILTLYNTRGKGGVELVDVLCVVRYLDTLSNHGYHYGSYRIMVAMAMNLFRI